MLLGVDFKVKYGNTFYKMLASNLTHHGFTYKIGENIDHNEFEPSGSCLKGGLYFINLNNLLQFVMYGPYIGLIEISDDAQVYIEKDKFKANKVTLVKILNNEVDILELLRLSFHNGCLFPVDMCEYAALHGYLEILKWARAHECRWNRWTCSYAAQNGHLEILKWMRDHKCEWDESICASAALNGHLETLKWARENGCPWDARTCAAAALNGHLETLKWAREHGCPWDGRTSMLAAQNCHLEILNWARENGCPCDAYVTSIGFL